jgi:hypothetical protein
VSLGFDANGHGTHVAGVAAAFGAHRGGMNGVAPGARLLVLKALDAAGDGYWSDIAEAMTYAAEQGAHIVLLSLAGGHAPGSLVGETQLMRRLTEQHGTVFVVAAGNQGPGLGSFNAPGDPQLSLAVGAYMSPAMWRVQYGYDVPAEGVWHFSASGPGPDGSLGPATLAPGSAVAPVPHWLSVSGYARFEGTSQAVPHLGGLLSLVMERARAEGVGITPRALGRAVEEGSRLLPAVPAVRQGHGLAEVPRVWAALARGPETGLRAWQAGSGGAAGGVYERGPQMAGTTALHISSDLAVFRRLTVSGPAWMTVDRHRLTLPAVTTRKLEVRFGNLPGPGLHSDRLFMDDPVTPGMDLSFPLTFAIPSRFPDDGLLRLDGELAPGGSVHHYFEIVPGTTTLRIRMSVSAARGQAQLHLLRPDGRELWSTGLVGHPEQPGDVPEEWAEWTVRSPVAGVWEMVVASSPALSRYGLTSTIYGLEVVTRALRVEPARLQVGNPAGGHALRSTLILGNWPEAARPRALAFSVGAGDPLMPGLHHVAGGDSKAIVLRPVAPGVSYLRVEVGNAPVPGADLSLTLYHQDLLTGRWTELASAHSPGTAREVIELFHPPPGKLIAYVEAAGFSGLTSFELTELALSGSTWLAVSDMPLGVRPGERADLSVTTISPEHPGEHHGLILIRDDATGDVLATIPVLAVTRPKLEVEMLAPPLAPGRRELVTVRVRDAANGHPVATDIVIDGRRWTAPRGEVAYPVSPVAQGELAVRISIRDPRYAPLDATFRLPVTAQQLAMLPAEAGGSEADRHKVRNFLMSR